MSHLLLLVQQLIKKEPQLKLISLVSKSWEMKTRTHFLYANELLCCAAEWGSENLCRLAKEWGARHFHVMLKTAAHEGHENLCRLAKKWGAMNFTEMYEESSDPLIRKLAKRWMTNYKKILEKRLVVKDFYFS